MQILHFLRNTPYQPGANLTLLSMLIKIWHVKTNNIFIASYLNMPSLTAQIFVGNCVAILSTEVCCCLSNSTALCTVMNRFVSWNPVCPECKLSYLSFLLFCIKGRSWPGCITHFSCTRSQLLLNAALLPRHAGQQIRCLRLWSDLVWAEENQSRSL